MTFFTSCDLHRDKHTDTRILYIYTYVCVIAYRVCMCLAIISYMLSHEIWYLHFAMWNSDMWSGWSPAPRTTPTPRAFSLRRSQRPSDSPWAQEMQRCSVFRHGDDTLMNYCQPGWLFIHGDFVRIFAGTTNLQNMIWVGLNVRDFHGFTWFPLDL